MIDKIDVYNILFNLPEGKRIDVKLEQICLQLKRDMFTGLDMIGTLRREDILAWIKNAEEHHDMKIRYDVFDDVISFYRPKKEVEG